RRLCHAGLISHYGNKQICDAGPAHVAKRGEMLAVRIFEQQNAAAEHRALVNRLERLCCGEMLGIHHHFQIARLEFFHAAFEHDATAVDEHEIGQDVLDLFHLMSRHYDSTTAIEVVVQQ